MFGNPSTDYVYLVHLHCVDCVVSRPELPSYTIKLYLRGFAELPLSLPQHGMGQQWANKSLWKLDGDGRAFCLCKHWVSGGNSSLDSRLWEKGPVADLKLSCKGKCAHGHGPWWAPPKSVFAPLARLFMSMVGPLQVWSHHRHERVGGWHGCKRGRCLSGTGGHVCFFLWWGVHRHW